MCEVCDISKAEKPKKLSKKLRDLPRFKCILEYEADFKKKYEIELKKMAYEISKKFAKTILKT